MKIKFEDIKLPPISERQRTTSGRDTSKLEDSIYKLGQLHELTLDGDMVLRAGWRRYHAIGNLREKCPKDERFKFIKVDIRPDLTELQYFDIELEENWRRQNLTSYELGETLSKRKKMYEELHPETIQGANIVKGKEQYQTKQKLVESRIAQRAKRVESKKGIFQDRKETLKSKIEPADRYTKNTAELLGTSERQIYKHLQVSKAIEEKKVDVEIVEKYKENKIPFSKILREVQAQKKLKKEREKKKKLGLENAQDIDSTPLEQIPYLFEDNDEVASVAVILPPPKPTPKVVWCKECKHGHLLACPECLGQVIGCATQGYMILKRKTSEGCEKYEA